MIMFLVVMHSVIGIVFDPERIHNDEETGSCPLQEKKQTEIQPFITSLATCTS